MPWALLLLMGGGFALAKATKVSGLSAWMAEQLRVLDVLDGWLLVLVVSASAAMATEFTSNSATASILLPVLRDLVKQLLKKVIAFFAFLFFPLHFQSSALKLNPLFLMLPATVSCSFAFMMPVATPPNAIVYTASGMRTIDMVRNVDKSRRL